MDKITSPIPTTVLTVMVPSDDQILTSDISTVIVTSRAQPTVTVDPSTITSSARVAGGMRIQSLPKQSSKRKRTGIMTSSSAINCKRAKPSVSSATVTIVPIPPSSRDNNQLTPWNFNQSSSKRKCPSTEIISNTPKRQCLSGRQDTLSSISTPSSKNNNTDLIDFNNIDLFKFNFNVCVLHESAEGDSQCVLLASVPMEAGE